MKRVLVFHTLLLPHGCHKGRARVAPNPDLMTERRWRGDGPTRHATWPSSRQCGPVDGIGNASPAERERELEAQDVTIVFDVTLQSIKLQGCITVREINRLFCAYMMLQPRYIKATCSQFHGNTLCLRSAQRLRCRRATCCCCAVFCSGSSNFRHWLEACTGTVLNFKVTPLHH